MTNAQIKDRQKGCFYGLAIGDALGAAVEFKMPGTFPHVIGYRGLGPHNLDAGQWTDDTSMALALADSLAGGFNKETQLDNYIAWYKQGKYGVNGFCFDIGNNTREALNRYIRTDELEAIDDPRKSGNGSIMRLAPVPIVYHLSYELTQRYSARSSSTTHNSEMCKSACAFMGVVLAGLIRGETKETVLDPSWEPTANIKLEPSVRKVANGSYKSGKVIGSGFVVESLEASLWAFWSGQSFEEVVLRAVNLGNDSDTTGAIAGQFAGALYGYSSIPKDLIDGLARKDLIDLYLNELIEPKS